MNTTLADSSKCYVATVNGRLAAFFAVIHFPHPSSKRIKRGHRLVVLPEFQGLGLGHQLSSKVAQRYVDQGYRFIITSNTKALYEQRKKDKRWLIKRIGRNNAHNDQTDKMTSMAKTGSTNRITISYEYVGEGKNG